MVTLPTFEAAEAWWQMLSESKRLSYSKAFKGSVNRQSAYILSEIEKQEMHEYEKHLFQSYFREFPAVKKYLVESVLRKGKGCNEDIIQQIRRYTGYRAEYVRFFIRRIAVL